MLWTLLPLVPVLYVNQEMVLRLGTVTGVGHARLILERLGKFWGAFSVIDLFLLNALIGRLSLEPDVTAATWQVDRTVPEAWFDVIAGG